MKNYNKLTTRNSNYLKDNKKPTPKKMTKNQKRKKTPTAIPDIK